MYMLLLVFLHFSFYRHCIVGKCLFAISACVLFCRHESVVLLVGYCFPLSFASFRPSGGMDGGVLYLDAVI